MNKIDQLWEKRSRLYGRAIEGVLPKSLPKVVNEYLDEWMFLQIKKVVIKDKNLKVLDLGCGYGRLSKKLLENFPKIRIYGIDISSHYVDLYNNDLAPKGEARKGDIKKLPFQDDFFDVVFMVTTLMYLTKKMDQQKAIQELLRVLKKDGKFIVIERNPWGHSIMSLGGLISVFRRSKFKEIQATNFSYNNMYDLFSKNGAVVESFSGIPFWTILIHPIILLSFISPRLGGELLKIISLVDKIFSWFLTPSMYISYIGGKKNL